MDNLPFSTHDLLRVIENQGRALANAIDSLTEIQVLNTSQENMPKYLIEEYRINPIDIDKSNIEVYYDDAMLDVSVDFRRAIYNRSEPFLIAGARFIFYMSFNGDS